MAERIKIDPEAGKAWCAALDSSIYEQGSGTLKRSTDGAYCCLGVFARVQGANEVPIMDDPDEDVEVVARWTFEIAGSEVSSDDLLYQEWADTFGITTEHQSFFSALNDGSTTFTAFAGGHDTAPFYPVMVALANDPVTDHGLVSKLPSPTKETISITFRKHSFREISEIIKTHML